MKVLARPCSWLSQTNWLPHVIREAAYRIGWRLWNGERMKATNIVVFCQECGAIGQDQENPPDGLLPELCPDCFESRLLDGREWNEMPEGAK